MANGWDPPIQIQPSRGHHRRTRLPQRRTRLHNPLPPQILAILKAIAKTNRVTFHAKTSRNIGTGSENQTNTSTPSAIARKMSTNSRGRLSLPPVSCRKRMKQHRGNVTKLVTISTMTGVIELKKPVSKNISEQTNPNETKAMPIGTARHLIRNSETLIVLVIWKNNIPKKEMLFRFFVRFYDRLSNISRRLSKVSWFRSLV